MIQPNQMPPTVHDALFNFDFDQIAPPRQSARQQQGKPRELLYEPRSHFLEFHQRQTRWACIDAHRRSGKTVACVNELIIRALYTKKKNPKYAYIAPFYSQAKNIAWLYLKEYARPFIQSAKDIRESELQVTLLNGATIRLYGADNPDALRGIYLDGVILDEFGDCRPSLWGEVILPTLADRKGWACFIGTPKGKNHFWVIRERARKEKNWFALTLKASMSKILDDAELAELKAQMSEAQYAQELECDFGAAVLGTFFAAQINLLEQKNQIKTDLPQHDPTQPVHVATDLGFTDSTAMWFWQHAPDGIAIIDYEEYQGKKLAFYLDLLDSKPYKYDTIWLPHDARAKTLQTGRTTVEQFIDPQQTDQDDQPLPYHRPPYPIDITPNVAVMQGIEAARLVLPLCHFNQTQCYAGIEALRAYRRKYDEILKTFSNKPLHDWASNGADAFRYMALVAKDKLPVKIQPRPIQEILQPLLKPPEYRLDELFADREQGKGKHNFQRARI